MSTALELTVPADLSWSREEDMIAVVCVEVGETKVMQQKRVS